MKGPEICILSPYLMTTLVGTLELDHGHNDRLCIKYYLRIKSATNMAMCYKFNVLRICINGKCEQKWITTWYEY
jgi:hypothetical protein